MKRRLFFWLEQLRITPGERKSVSLLLALLLALALIEPLVQRRIPYGDTDYAELEEAFRQQAERAARRESEVMRRFGLETEPAGADTLSAVRAFGLIALPRVEINGAGYENLLRLPGIGPVLARRLLEFRAQYGPFSRMEDLLQVRGIGKKRLDNLRPFIKLKRPTDKPIRDVKPDTVG